MDDLITYDTRDERYQAVITCRLVETREGPRPMLEVGLVEKGSLYRFSRLQGNMAKANEQVRTWCAGQ